MKTGENHLLEFNLYHASPMLNVNINDQEK